MSHQCVYYHESADPRSPTPQHACLCVDVCAYSHTCERVCPLLICSLTVAPPAVSCGPLCCEESITFSRACLSTRDVLCSITSAQMMMHGTHVKRKTCFSATSINTCTAGGIAAGSTISIRREVNFIMTWGVVQMHNTKTSYVNKIALRFYNNFTRLFCSIFF